MFRFDFSLGANQYSAPDRAFGHGMHGAGRECRLTIGLPIPASGSFGSVLP